MELFDHPRQDGDIVHNFEGFFVAVAASGSKLASGQLCKALRSIKKTEVRTLNDFATKLTFLASKGIFAAIFGFVVKMRHISSYVCHYWICFFKHDIPGPIMNVIGNSLG